MKPIFAIKDRAIDGYPEIFVQPSTQHAVRWFRDLVNLDPEKSNIAKHPDDYDLYTLGTFDEETGAIDAIPPAVIARGKDLINPKE